MNNDHYKVLPTEQLPAVKAMKSVESQFLNLLYTMKVCLNPDLEEWLESIPKNRRLEAMIMRSNHTTRLMSDAIARAEGRA